MADPNICEVFGISSFFWALRWNNFYKGQFRPQYQNYIPGATSKTPLNYRI